MGGKGGGSGSTTPDFILEGTKDLSERSQQLFDIARPLLETGTSQIASLIRTGGPGANVPIINQAVAAQRSATSQAQAGIGGDLRRAGLEQAPRGSPGGVRPVPGSGSGGATTNPVSPNSFGPTSGPFARRIREQLQQRGDVAANAIPTRVAAPLIGAASSAAIGGGQAAAQGFQGSLSALGQAGRVGAAARAAAAAQRRNNGIQLGRNLIGLGQFGGDQGFFDFLNRGAGPSGTGVDSPAFGGFTPAPIQGGLPF